MIVVNDFLYGLILYVVRSTYKIDSAEKVESILLYSCPITPGSHHHHSETQECSVYNFFAHSIYSFIR